MPSAPSSDPVRVTPESGGADRKAFFEFPYRLYRDHPTWVPPLRLGEKALMNRAKNPFFHHAEVEHFLARRGRHVVGRIAAIENRLHNEVHEDRIGFFGFFDVEPDPEAAAALVRAAKAWVETRGLGPMRGPVNYSTNDACGLLVDGFDKPPFLMMPYNRPDYESMLLAAGLVPVKDLLAYQLRTVDEMPERFARVVGRRLKRSKITLRDIDLKNFKQEVQVLKDLYNRSWEKNWGFVPATSEEFDHAANDLKAVVVPELSGVAERDGVPVGFSVFIRDLNQLLRGGSGRLTPALLYKLMFGMKKIRETRCVLLGIVPEARGNAINEAFFLRAKEAALRLGHTGSEAGWILDDNQAMRRPIEAAGGVVTKRYRMYETPSTDPVLQR